MRAEDLDFGPVISWWNRNSPWNDSNTPQKLVHRFIGVAILGGVIITVAVLLTLNNVHLECKIKATINYYKPT